MAVIVITPRTKNRIKIMRKYAIENPITITQDVVDQIKNGVADKGKRAGADDRRNIKIRNINVTYSIEKQCLNENVEFFCHHISMSIEKKGRKKILNQIAAEMICEEFGMKKADGWFKVYVEELSWTKALNIIQLFEEDEKCLRERFII